MPEFRTRVLLVMAHGSRATAANSEFLELVDNIKTKNLPYHAIVGVFLELSPPTLHKAIEDAYEKGERSFDVYPLFFNCGKHVQKDIPQQIGEILDRFDDIEVRLLDYFGSSNNLVTAVASHITDQKTSH